MCEKANEGVHFIPVTNLAGVGLCFYVQHNFIVLGAITNGFVPYWVPLKSNNFMDESKKSYNPHQFWLASVYNKQIAFGGVYATMSEDNNWNGTAGAPTEIDNNDILPIQLVKYIRTNDMYPAGNNMLVDFMGLVPGPITHVAVAMCMKKHE